MPHPPNRRAASAEETRRLILSAAKDLYLEKGFRHASSRELARRAGVAEGTVFAHFPDKASLLAAALHEDLLHVLAQAHASLQKLYFALYLDGARINVFPQASHVSCIGGLGGFRCILLIALPP